MIKTNIKKVKKTLHVLIKTTWYKQLFMHLGVTSEQFIYMTDEAQSIMAPYSDKVLINK